MTATRPADPMAVRLAVVIKRLRDRMRETRPDRAKQLPISHLAILKRLRDSGPTTASALAAAEHVSQQGIAQHVAALTRAGLVHARSDASDARKRLIHVTRAGHRLFETAADSRHAWLARVIDAELGVKDRPALEKAITLLERIAAAHDVVPNGT
ncbi:MAG: MarR family winged helix-turn-helix transcriptional regulator [Gemmatimonadaceae bacterium]